MRKRLCGAALSTVLALSLMLAPASAAEGTVVAPSGLLVLPGGGLAIADLYHRAIWQQDTDGTLSRIAGRDGVRDVNSQPLGGYNDNTRDRAAFQTPWSLAPYREGYAVADTENNVLRYVSADAVTTLAGSGAVGSDDGMGADATFDGPTGLCAGPDGSLYVADTGNHKIRRVDHYGAVTTLAGGGAGSTQGALAQARFYEPTALCYSDGILYVADSGNNRLCQVDLDAGTVTALAGGGPGEEGEGFQDGSAESALFSHPQGIAVAGESLYIADTGNGAVRLMERGRVTTLMESGGGPDGLYPISPRALAIDGSTLYVGDVFSRQIFTLPIDPAGQACPSNFSDVMETDWYATAVAQVSALGLMNGVGDGRFAPGAGFSRAMCVTVLSRMAGATAGGASPFPDVAADAYYATAAGWAAEQGIVQGVEGQFLPHRATTRAELAVFLFRFAGIQGIDQTGRADLSGFSDAANIPDWARESLAWCVDAGLLSGRPDQRLAPGDPATRAEVAVVLQRFLALEGD